MQYTHFIYDENLVAVRHVFKPRTTKYGMKITIPTHYRDLFFNNNVLYLYNRRYIVDFKNCCLIYDSPSGTKEAVDSLNYNYKNLQEQSVAKKVIVVKSKATSKDLGIHQSLFAENEFNSKLDFYYGVGIQLGDKVYDIRSFSTSSENQVYNSQNMNVNPKLLVSSVSETNAPHYKGTTVVMDYTDERLEFFKRFNQNFDNIISSIVSFMHSVKSGEAIALIDSGSVPLLAHTTSISEKGEDNVG